MGGATSKVLALFVLLFSFCCWIKAADTADANLVNLGALELDKTYTLKAETPYYGYFTPEKSGWLVVEGTSVAFFTPVVEWKGSMQATLWDDDRNQYAITSINTNNADLKRYEIHVDAGTTYWFVRSNTPESDVDCSLSMNKERNLLYYGPLYAEGQVVTPTKKTQLSFSFNRKVKYATATVVANGNTVSLSGRTNGTNINVDVKDILIDMATQKGYVKPGDELEIHITGIRSADGEFTLDKDIDAKYIMGDVPVALVKATNTEGSILTWYEPGDPAGMITLEFSDKISQASAIINYGKTGRGTESSDFVRIPIEPIIEGNKLILDLTGVRRLPSDMIAADGIDFSEDDFKKITIGITGIRDENGQSTYPSSKWMTFDLVTLTADIASYFIPGDGSNIDDEKEITIWINDESKLKYSGVDFTYIQNGEQKVMTVTDMKKVSAEDADFPTAKMVTVNIPDEVRGKGDIMVSLHDLTCADGKDYSKDIAAEFVSNTSTGIQNVQLKQPAHVEIYNLNGLKLNPSTALKKGVYIVNGKKVVK